LIYQLDGIKDLENLPNVDTAIYNVLLELTSALTFEYSDISGGYVLYATPGTTAEELKAIFDYSAHTIEYVNRTLKAEPPICSAFYILQNDYVVTIVMSINDTPKEITDNFEEGY
jgi:hypothetical protein